MILRTETGKYEHEVTDNLNINDHHENKRQTVKAITIGIRE